MRRRLGIRLSLLVVVAFVGYALPALAGSGPPTPSNDSFYIYAGEQPLADVQPGAVLRERSIQPAFGTTATPLRAE